jgi:outer membrane protein assembly factor BamB/subtilisin family serine protease
VRCLFAFAAAAKLGCVSLAAPPQVIGGLSLIEQAQGFRGTTVVAKPKLGMLPVIDRLEQAEGLTLKAKFERFGNVRVLTLAAGDTVKAAVRRLMATGRYEYVEPDYVRHATTVPNDPQFSSQWALNNTGVNGGIAGADIHAEAAWDTLTNAPGVIAGIVDSGALTTHEDLAANMWINPSPGTSKIYGGTLEVDSLNGLNAVTSSGLPTDDLGHGTHVSGIVGAVGNNSLGVSGVAWKVQLMELKFIDSSGSGSASDELPCIDYAIAHNANVLNGSFGDQTFSQAEMDAIHAAGQAGIIFVCAAGNSSENVDISPFFPADYPLDNIICVGATDNRDLPVYFSNYGSGTVEIFAPGENILSTYFSSTSSYMYLSGTSMASPMVTGTVALLRAKFPSDTYRETINRVLNSADTNPGLAGKSQTGGRVDLAKALTTAANTPPNMLFANRTVLVGLDPYTRSNNADSPAALEAGTPSIVGVAGSHSLWWQWTAPENAAVEIDTSGTGGGKYPGGSTYSTLLGVYTGTSLSSLSFVAGSSNFGTEPVEGGSGTVQNFSEVTFHAVAGTTYQINVQGQSGESGQTILSINTTPDNASAASPTVLSGPSTSLQDANPNTGGQPLWYSWKPAFSGSAQVSAYSYDFTVKAAVYAGPSSSPSLIVSSVGAAPKGTTTVASECLCTFTAVAGTTYLISVGGASSTGIGQFTVAVDDSQWQAVTGDAVTCSPAIAPDGSVYVGSNDNIFYAFNPDGSVKWTHTAQSVFDTSSAAIGPDGSVYAGCTDGNVYAFAADGTLKWTFTVPTPSASSGLDKGLSSSPALGADGTVYIHDDDGNLYAINSLGALSWTAPATGVSYAAPTIALDGTIYLGTFSGFLYAFNPDGSVKWTFTAPVAGEEIYTAAAIDASGNLYFGTLSGNFYSIDSTGHLRWSFSASASISSAPALANGAVYFGGYDGNLYSLSTGSGALNWKYSLGTQVRASAPAVDVNGVIYIGCYDHNVYAINLHGALVRIFASDDYIRSSPVISGTSLCFGSEDHKVYEFNIGAGPGVSDWPMYQFNAQRVGRLVASVVAITSQPASQSVAPGSSFTLSVGAIGPGAITYQWNLNGTAIAGAVNPTYSVSSATSADAGSYTVTVTSGSGSVTSSPAIVTVSASAAARLINLSARASVGTGGNILIAGFVLGGTGSKTMLLRGVGPALGLAPFDVSGSLAQPQLTLVDTTPGSSSTIVSAASWGGSPALSAAFSANGAFAFAAGSADSAVLETLPAGDYTSEIAGATSTTGIALAEIYDTDPGSTSLGLVDISARAFVSTGGDILIAGFVVEGSQPAQVLLRGIGPALAAAPFNLPGVLAQPEIKLYNTSTGTSVLVATNTGWGGSSALVSAFSQAGAFQLPSGSSDAAMVETLPAGNYTLELSGQNGTTGIGLVEVYLLR